MKTIITFEFDENDGNNPSNYIDPYKYLVIIGEINNYMRQIDKYGNEFKDVPQAVYEIRKHINELCAEVPEDYKF